MCRLAAQVLASMGNSGRTMEASSNPSWQLSATAKPERRFVATWHNTWANLKYPAGSKVDYTALADAEGCLVVDVCQQEVERAKNLNRGGSRRLTKCGKRSIVLQGLGKEPSGGKAGHCGMPVFSAAASRRTRILLKPLKTKLNRGGSNGSTIPSSPKIKSRPNSLAAETARKPGPVKEELKWHDKQREDRRTCHISQHQPLHCSGA